MSIPTLSSNLDEPRLAHQLGQQSPAFALEADPGTMTRRTSDDKITGYWRFLEQNRQTKAYGVKWFGVITVTLTQARADGLAEICQPSDTG